MTKEEFKEFVTNATFDTTMQFEELGERDMFIDRIVAQWEQDIEDACTESFQHGSN